MKITHIETLISVGAFSKSNDWKKIRKAIHTAIRAVSWPPGTRKFTIFPERGKERGQGNGVKPIKSGLMAELKEQTWRLEEALDIATVDRPGKLDAVLTTTHGRVALEWETGNISSSHRALNKMVLGMLKRVLVGGVLVVPTRELYQYLTDRVGNWNELAPYLDLWRSVPCKNGVLEIVVVEHDAISKKVPKIPKGTDGRAIK
jgi:Restriction endonuclease BamHI